MCNERENAHTDIQTGDIVRIQQMTGISGTPPHVQASFVYEATVLGVAGDYAVVQRAPTPPLAVTVADLRKWAQVPLSNASL